MPPPSQLSIATSALMRLVKEEGSYHKELEQQKTRLAKIEKDEGDENKEFMIKQQHQAMEETNAMFPALRKRIKDAEEKLEVQLEAAKHDGGEGNTDEITKAEDAIAAAKNAQRGAV